MFSNSDRDKKITLGEMKRTALNLCNSNQVEAEKKMVELVQQDRRFDDLDATKVVKKVGEAWSNGAKLDLEANELKPGGKSWADAKSY
jgi:hypothetical protein